MFAVAEAASPENAAAGANSKTPATEPVIELVSDANGIKRIVITCSCCRRIELECQYE